MTPFRNLLAFCLLLLASSLHAQKPYQEFNGCELVSTEWSDGDSFLVKLPDGSEEVFRLYFVDCLESQISTESDRRRLREQAQYFGVRDYAACRDFGLAAKELTAKLLARPFTVFTGFADARGRSGYRRSYAMVYTAEGNDLAVLLVNAGMARASGVTRATPGGTRGDDHTAYLEDLEFAAAVKQVGIWGNSDPNALVAMRKDRREEERMLEAVDAALAVKPLEQPVDVNIASLEELQRAGLSVRLADEVIKSRPFKTVEELDRVRGIGPKTLETVRPYLKVGADS